MGNVNGFSFGVRRRFITITFIFLHRWIKKKKTEILLNKSLEVENPIVSTVEST